MLSMLFSVKTEMEKSKHLVTFGNNSAVMLGFVFVLGFKKLP